MTEHVNTMQSRFYNECNGHVKVQTGGYNLIEPCDGTCQVKITCPGHSKLVEGEHVTTPCDGTCNAVFLDKYKVEPIPRTDYKCYYGCGLQPFVSLGVTLLPPNPNIQAEFRLCYVHYRLFTQEFVGIRVTVQTITYYTNGIVTVRQLTPVQQHEGRAVALIIDLAFNCTKLET